MKKNFYFTERCLSLMPPRSEHMKFNVGDKFKIWIIDNIAYIHISSYKNGGKWTLEELKKSIYDHMCEKEFEVAEVKPFKVCLKHLDAFYKVNDWYSKKLIEKWFKNNYSKDALWLYLYNKELKK